MSASNRRASPRYIITTGLLLAPEAKCSILLPRLPWYMLYRLAQAHPELRPWYELTPDQFANEPPFLGAIYCTASRLRKMLAPAQLHLDTHAPWGLSLRLPPDAELIVTGRAVTAAELLCPSDPASA